MKATMLAIAAALSLAACAPINWNQKPGGTAETFAQDDAKCRLFARGVTPSGFYAQGSPGFVLGASLGNAIGTAIAVRANYRDCMIASGYTPGPQQ
jgi:hypothetical protein